MVKFNFFKRSKSDDLNKKGVCFLCLDKAPRDEFGQVLPSQEENMFNLFGVEVCEGCYHDLINHMGYKNLDDLMTCDKQQLMKFLNKLSEQKRNI